MRSLLTLLLLLALLPIAGCNIAAPVFFAVHGPPKTKALTSLDSSRKTVVFIDDLRSNLPRRSLRHVIAEGAEQELMQRGVVAEANMISSRSVIHEAGLETYSERLSIVELGRRVQAEVVIYVEVLDWTLSREGGGLAPQARLGLKIIDTLADERVFPTTAGAFGFTVKMPVQSKISISTLSEKAALEQGLAELCGYQVARLFYDHEKDPISTRSR